MIREKQIKSGRLLEADFYPAFSDGRRMPTRAPKQKLSTVAQQKYNHLQSQKKAVRIVNANFNDSDNYTHVTYAPEDAPTTMDEAYHDFEIWKRRIKAERKRELERINKSLESSPDNKKLLEKKKKLSEPFLYYGRMEEEIYKSGINKGKSNFHFHIFMSGGLDRDVVEDLWVSKARINANRFQPERFGPEAAARYMTKQIEGRTKTLRSRNLKPVPDPKYKDGHIGRFAVERMAKQRAEDKDYWEKRYKGYKFLRCYARYNNYNGHWYVSVVMYKADKDTELPRWTAPEWIE